MKGFAPSLDVMLRYRVLLAPLRFGAGLKGKVCECAGRLGNSLATLGALLPHCRLTPGCRLWTPGGTACPSSPPPSAPRA